MKTLTEVFDPAEFERLTALLHGKGIPTISNGNGLRRAPYQRTICVCLNEQYDDAVTLLKFPSYTPKVQVSVDAFFRRAYGRNIGRISGWLKWAVVVGTVALIILANLVRQH